MATVCYAKQHRLLVFPSLLHRSLVAAHQVENLRTRIFDGVVWRYEQIHVEARSDGQTARSAWDIIDSSGQLTISSEKRPSSSTVYGNEMTSNAIQRQT